MKWLTCTNVSIAIFVLYVYVTVKEIYQIMNPEYVIGNAESLDPLWKTGQLLEARCYLSPYKTWKTKHFTHEQVYFIGSFQNLSFDWKDNERSVVLNISVLDVLNGPTKQIQNQARMVWKRLRNNQTMYAHVHVSHQNISPNPKDKNYDPVKVISKSTSVVKFAARQNIKNATYLLAPYHSIFQEEPTKPLIDPLNEVYDDEDPALTSSIVSYWKPEIAIRLVTDFTRFPLRAVPHLVFPHLSIKQKDSSYYYMPIMYVDEMGMTKEKLTPLNRTSTTLTLRVTYEPITLARWQMMLMFEQAMETQKSLGIGEDDIDDIRNMIAETNPIILGITFFVSMLHMLFDFLAFKSDIAFWKENKSLVGISVRSMGISFFCQIIIFLYLYEEKTTLLVLVPNGISLLIQIWKIIKATGATISWAPKIKLHFPRLKSTSRQTTSHMDNVAMNYMGYILYPLLLGFSLYSLVYKKHTGWYSWFLKSLTGTVYAFGFIMMTPQLFINYKLKSVAHLPWRFLIYRALNTFIDDLFAFIIHMPTMHRISCFRDDIVFFIYLYQRWIYPVDKTRKLQLDENGEEVVEDTNETKKDQ